MGKFKIGLGVALALAITGCASTRPMQYSPVLIDSPDPDLQPQFIRARTLQADYVKRATALGKESTIIDSLALSAGLASFLA